MKKQLMIVGIIFILLTVGLSGCEQTTLKSDDEKFIGKWICNKEWYNDTIIFTYNDMIIFTQDHKYQSYNPIWGDGLYEVKNGQLILAMSNSNYITHKNVRSNQS